VCCSIGDEKSGVLHSKAKSGRSLGPYRGLVGGSPPPSDPDRGPSLIPNLSLKLVVIGWKPSAHSADRGRKPR
jgi:hypothetical protein